MTVPTAGTLPVPPLDVALLLDRATNLTTLAAGDLDQALENLPRDVPLFAVVDVLTAVRYLRKAIACVDRVAEQITQAVTA